MHLSVCCLFSSTPSGEDIHVVYFLNVLLVILMSYYLLIICAEVNGTRV